MARTPVFLFLLLLAFALLAASPALAGGWAVITLDELPGEIRPSQPLEIGFTVRQHGDKPLEGLDPAITLIQADTGERFNVLAEPGDRPGHYRATLNFPAEGRWNWSIQAFTMDQEMPPLMVSPASGANQVAPKTAFPLPAATAGAGIVITLAALGILLRKRARWAFALVLAGLMVTTFGLLSASAGRPGAEPIQVIEGSMEKTGQELFLAKGCITCHSHEEVTRGRNSIYVDVGPDLSAFTADPDYLRRWLEDPGSVKPSTLMPDLELEDGEIEALIAFLNAE
jgi:cytochrome c2